MKWSENIEKKACFGIAILFLIFGALLTIPVAKRITPTVDEYAHLPAGYSYWKAGEAKIYRKNPPLVKLLISLPLLKEKPEFDIKKYMEIRDRGGGWAPWQLGREFMDNNREDYLDLFFLARCVVIFMAFCSGLIIYSLSSRIFGHRGAALSVAVYSLSPNLIAHASLATVDIGFTFFLLLAVHEAMRLHDTHSGWSLLTAGAALGLALTAKFTGLFLLPYFVLLSAISLLTRKAVSGGPLQNRVSSEAFYLVTVFLIAFLTIWSVFGLIRTGTSFHGVLLEGKAPKVKVLPFEKTARKIPLPENYVMGFYEQYRDTQKGEFKDANYLNGKWYNGPDWKYFPVAFLLKTPVAEILLMAASWLYLVFLLLRKNYSAASAKSLKYNLLPALFVILPIMFFSGLNLGIRYIIPAFPLFHIGIGALALLPTFSRRIFWVPIIALVAWLGITTVRAFPNYLPYFNEFAGGMENGEKYLLDSNIDWGQDLYLLKEYMDKNGIEKIGLAYFGHVDPDLYKIKYENIKPGFTGIAAVSVNFVHGYPYVINYTIPLNQLSKSDIEALLRDKRHVYRKGDELLIYDKFPRDKMRQILKGKKPKARLGGSILIYEIEQEQKVEQ